MFGLVVYKHWYECNFNVVTIKIVITFWNSDFAKLSRGHDVTWKEKEYTNCS